MALPSNDPKQLTQASILSRLYNGESLDGAFIFEGITTDDSATELFLSYPDTQGLTPNSVVEVTEQSRLEIPKSSIVYVEGTTLGLQIDTADKAVHHISKFEFSVFRPTTGDAVFSGNHVSVTTNPAGSITSADATNPGWYLALGTQTNAVFTLNTAGYLNCVVTGEASQTIKWLVSLDKVRVVAD